jgi:cytochrome c-type biogenesis protein CcmH
VTGGGRPVCLRRRQGSIALLAALLLVSPPGLAVHPQASGAAAPVAAKPSRAASQDAADADAFARRMRAHLQSRPRDARGWVILARMEAERDRFAEAAQAYEKALALPSKVARDAAVWCEYADALGMTQGGRLAGKPRELIDRALVLDPNHPKALELAGSAEYERGDYRAALGFWRPLLAELKPGSGAHAELAAAIARTERLAATSLPSARR